MLAYSFWEDASVLLRNDIMVISKFMFFFGKRSE